MLPTGETLSRHAGADACSFERATDALHCTGVDSKPFDKCARHQCVQEPTYGWLMRFLHGGAPIGFRHLQVDV
jgi:hypothetical protein